MSHADLWIYSCAHPGRSEPNYGFVGEPPSGWFEPVIDRARSFARSFQWHPHDDHMARWPSLLWLLEVDSAIALLVGLQDGGPDRVNRPHTVHLIFRLVPQPIDLGVIARATSSDAWRAASAPGTPALDTEEIRRNGPPGRVRGVKKLVDHPPAYKFEDSNSKMRRKMKGGFKVGLWAGVVGGLVAGFFLGQVFAPGRGAGSAPPDECHRLATDICDVRDPTLSIGHDVAQKWLRCAVKPLQKRTADPPPATMRQAISQVTECLNSLPNGAQGLR